MYDNYATQNRAVNGQTTAIIHTFEIVGNESILAKIQFLVLKVLQAVIAQLLGCINSSSFRHRVVTARAINGLCDHAHY